MRIIKCYIENFGGLHKMAVNLQDGLNTINKPNGFGKTTLAEFIRVMFYGFTGKGRDIEANDRKRYLPWNGGKFGGNLEFEVNGRKYRIERYFGRTAKGDTFALYDAVTNRLSKDYSSNIGVELFNLDSESFIRCIYIKHNGGNFDSFSTDSIRAKLGNLVEDTNDVNNYEKAMKALKDKRAQLTSNNRAHSVAKDANEKIGEAEIEISRIKGIIQKKDEISTQLDIANKEIYDSNHRISDIRQEITELSKVEGKKAVENQILLLEEEIKSLTEKIDKIKVNYTSGFPTDDEISEMETLVDRLKQLEDTKINLSIHNDRELVSNNSKKFKSGVPDSDTIADYIKESREYSRLCDNIKTATPTERQLRDYEVMQSTFKGGVPTENEIADKINLNTEIEQLKAKVKSIDTTSLEAKYQFLNVTFYNGIPSNTEIEQAQANIDRIEALKENNSNLACGIDESIEVIDNSIEHKSNSNKILLGAIGVVCILTGAIVSALVNMVGLVGVGIGLLLVILALIVKPKVTIEKIQTKSKVNEESNNLIRESIRKNNVEIQQLEANVGRFISKYINDGRDLRERLIELSAKIREYTEIKQAIEKATSEKNELFREIQKKDMILTDWLSVYMVRGESFNSDVIKLKNGIQTYNEYTTRLEEYREARELYTEQANMKKDKIVKFLEIYYTEVNEFDFDSLLIRLGKDSTEYTNALARIEKHEASDLDRQSEMADIMAKFSDFLSRYNLNSTEVTRLMLSEIRGDYRDLLQAEESLRNNISKLNSIKGENSILLNSEFKYSGKTLTELKDEERELASSIQEFSEMRILLEQKLEEIREAEDKLPLQQDILDYYLEVRNESTKQDKILEATSVLLTNAKEALATSYMGKVVESFTKYLEYLLPDDAETTTVDSELGINVVRLGESRIKGYLSSGQLDLINLCMRLALVESLFDEEKPFLILDDPFTNLDDEAVIKALDVLKKLGNEHQIVYLTCSSSRV